MKNTTCHNAKQAHALRSVCTFACAGALGLIIGNGIVSISTSVPVAYATSANQQGGGTTSENVVIPDPNLKAALLEEMKYQHIIKKDATDITKDDALKVTRLKSKLMTVGHFGPLVNQNISNLTGLEYFTNLEVLDLATNNIENLQPLQSLTKLKTLDLSANKISNLDPLRNLTSLNHLYLYNNKKISDISPLSALTQISTLDLDNNSISNLQPLKKLTHLIDLGLGGNKIADDQLQHLVQSTNLRFLNLSKNKITNVTPLSVLTHLEQLDLSKNQITDFSPIYDEQITRISLDSNSITDIEKIKNMRFLKTFSLKDDTVTRKVSASSIQLSSLLSLAKYCKFTVDTKDAGTVENGVFTLNKMPEDKLVTLSFEITETGVSQLRANESGKIICSGKLVLDYSSEDEPLVEPQVAPLYRLYNPYTHEHFFTAETVENDNLVRLGWKSEGGVGYIYKHGEKGGVYRLYNPTTGEHHYTMNEDEVATCVKAGWKNEGVKWFSAQDKEVTLNKLYSMYNPYEKKFYHHYTADAKEIEQMVKAGWRKEEVKWCTLPVSAVK